MPTSRQERIPPGAARAGDAHLTKATGHHCSCQLNLPVSSELLGDVVVSLDTVPTAPTLASLLGADSLAERFAAGLLRAQSGLPEAKRLAELD